MCVCAETRAVDGVRPFHPKQVPSCNSVDAFMVESDGPDAMTANLVDSSSDKQALVAAPRWPLAYAALCLANMAEAVEVLTAGYILERATDDEFVQTSIAAAVFIGMMFGGLFSGPAADAYGRAALLKWALALSTVASFAAAAASTPSSRPSRRARRYLPSSRRPATAARRPWAARSRTST